jgi:hypothetical protein
MADAGRNRTGSVLPGDGESLQKQKASPTTGGFTCTHAAPAEARDVIPMERPQENCRHTKFRSD